MAYVANKDDTLHTSGYKWSNLRNDTSDIVKVSIACLIACCFCVFVIIFNILLFIVSKINILISSSTRNLPEISINK